MDRVTVLARMLVDKLSDYSFDTVLAPAMGGLVIGQEIARQTDSRFLFAEKVKDRLELRRNFAFPSRGEKVMVVEDVVTRGGRANEAISLADQAGGEVVGLAVLVDRSNGNANFPVPFVPLISIVAETFSPEDLPDDLKSIPPVKPGS